jgi:hypothetical protein
MFDILLQSLEFPICLSFHSKLQEVKERLNELRSLVQYYQTTTAAGEVPAVDERTAFQNMIEGYGQGIPAQNIV